ncbi:ankyrin repeat-containing protein [Penicillium atrosanguineum]|nr:ankyrin repeat-containing protein [Penicillium atrosanguineum]
MPLTTSRGSQPHIPDAGGRHYLSILSAPKTPPAVYYSPTYLLMRSETRAEVIVPAVTAIIGVILLFAFFTRERKQTEAPRPKSLTFRVDDIPIDHQNKFIDNLKSVAEQDPDLRRAIATIARHTLTPKDKRFACATISISTTLTCEELCTRLSVAGNLKGYKYSYTCVFDGITPLYEHQNGADVDIIAVPGLGSHAFGSWKAPNSDEVWLRDFLPEDIPNIRVLLYGYDTTLLNSFSKQSIEDLGRIFLEQITAFRANDGTTRRPIIFIGHSLGGLLIKEALIWAHRPGTIMQSELSKACFGLVFFGVPNLGLRNEQLKTIVQDQPNQALVDNLVVDNDNEPTTLLKRLTDQFAEKSKGLYRVVTFFERKYSPILEVAPDGRLRKTGRLSLLVTEKSATSTGLVAMADEDSIPFNTDHSGLVKYRSRNQGDYTVVRERIRLLVDEAKLKVANRFLEYMVSSTQRSTLVKGKPGSGKSTVMKYALRELPAIYDAEPITISFFFHARGHELQKSPLGLFRSFLHQILRRVPGALRDMIAYFDEQQRTIGEVGRQWTWELQILHSFLESSLPRILERFPVTLYIDALDECGEEPAVKLIAFFIHLLSVLPSAGSRLGIFFSCRDYPVLELQEGLTIQLDAENEDDIKTFVRTQLDTSGTDLETQSMICDRAQGLFMWARIVVARVLQMERQGKQKEEIDAEIRNVPAGLDQLYRELIQDIEDQEDALKLVRWVCFSSEPLTTVELQWAMAVDPNCKHKSLDTCHRVAGLMTDEMHERKEFDYSGDRMHYHRNLPAPREAMHAMTGGIFARRIKTLSCGLVEIVNSEQGFIVQFIHQSVNDFFVKRGLWLLDQTRNPDLVGPAAHIYLSHVCIRYLKMYMTSYPGAIHRMDNQLFPLLRHAARSWIYYVEFGEPTETSLQDLLDRLDWPTEAFIEPWILISKSDYRSFVSNGSNLVHIASHYGVTKLLSCLIDTDTVDVNSKNDSGTTSLSYAARGGHESAVLSLLATGKVDVDLRNDGGRAPLSWAAQGGHGSIVKILLDTVKVDVDSRDRRGKTPLSYAARGGHGSVVEILIDTGKVDIDSRDNGGNTPLSYAAQGGYKSAVLSLLATGKVDIDSRNDGGRTPLSYAAQGGHELVVEILLGTGKVDIDSRDDGGITPLLYAALGGHELMVEILLATAKVDVDFRDNEGRTALLYAALSGHELVVEILLTTGKVDTDSRDDHGRTALSWAVQFRQESMVKILLDAGKADVNSRDNAGMTPLMIAEQNYDKVLIRMLLNTGKIEFNRALEFVLTAYDLSVLDGADQ